jgi:uncharacterized repeat protein (TIGR02543 family)
VRRNSLVPFLAAILLWAFWSNAGAVCTAGNPNPNLPESTPNGDLFDNGNGTVTHRNTGLMWKQCPEGLAGASCATPTGGPTTMTWGNALKAANAANAAAFAGYGDWRLPNVRELQSIVEWCGSMPSINRTAFPATIVYYFWSSSSYVPLPSNAWSVGFADGGSSSSPKLNPFAVRLVRGGQSLDYFDALNPTTSVFYDGNGSIGGSVPVDGAAYALGATVTVLGNTGGLVRTGYIFAGWNTAANGSGVSYSDGATFAMGSGNVTLYAQWAAAGAAATIPALNEWALLLLAGLVGLFGMAEAKRRSVQQRLFHRHP